MPKIFTAASTATAETMQTADAYVFDRKASNLEISAKRGFDVGAAISILLLLLPLIGAVALFMLLLQGRPVFIRHKRVGRNGTLFGCMKFRTMAVNAEEVLQSHLASSTEARAEWQATRKLKNDPRITILGHVMRKTSVDELPQLFNIVRGEMSLVGPRPIVPDEVHHYGACIDLYHSVRPGLTGAWQIGGRNNVSYTRRVEMDADYVVNWSFGRDMSILAKTVPAVLLSKGCY